MVHVVKRLCGFIFVSSVFICVYQNVGVYFNRCDNETIKQDEVCSQTLRNEKREFKLENEVVKELMLSGVPLENIYDTDFENYGTNVTSAHEKDTYETPILQKHRNCFGKSNLVSLNQTFVHLKSLNINCLSSADQSINVNPIYFLECTRNRGFKFKSIHWCSIESAAFHNQNKSIVVVFLFYNAFSAPTLMKKLASKYKNIYFLSLSSLKEFVIGSPYEHDLGCTRKSCRLLEDSTYPEYHYSDLLRVLLVYKFGGIYSDLDIVTLKPFPEVLDIKDLVAADTSGRLGNCFLKFKRGHSFLELTMRHIISNFNGTEWSANGPPRLSESLEQYCDNFHSLSKIPKGNGLFGHRETPPKTTPCIKKNLTKLEVLSPNYISQVHWHDVEEFFGIPTRDRRRNHRHPSDPIHQIKMADSFGVHFYNKITNKRFGRKYDNKELPFKKIFRENCPLTYEEWYV